jgi:hypothetical protein
MPNNASDTLGSWFGESDSLSADGFSVWLLCHGYLTTTLHTLMPG